MFAILWSVASLFNVGIWVGSQFSGEPDNAALILALVCLVLANQERSQ